MSTLTIEVVKDDAGNWHVAVTKDGERMYGCTIDKVVQHLEDWPLFESAMQEPVMEGLRLDIRVSQERG